MLELVRVARQIVMEAKLKDPHVETENTLVRWG